MTKEDLRRQVDGAAESFREKKKLNHEWYSCRSLFGYDWALFYVILGAREAGKSYAITKKYIEQFVKYGRPFYWLRLKEDQAKQLLQNKAEKLIDPDIRRKFDLDIMTNGNAVYVITKRDEKTNKIIEKKLMARVMALSTFYNDKGQGYFDKDFLNDPNMYYNIAIDEFQREVGEKNTFDICYALVNQLENILRSTKKRARIIFIGNTLEEASDILAMFNFIPEKFGRYTLKSKRCVIDYIEPSEKYLSRRKGTIADILAPDESTFTNEIKLDKSLVNNKRLQKPMMIIKFRKQQDKWFTVWDSTVIAKYNNEKVKNVITMRPYLDHMYNNDLTQNIIQAFDARGFTYKDLITFKLFQKEITLLRPKK